MFCMLHLNWFIFAGTVSSIMMSPVITGSLSSVRNKTTNNHQNWHYQECSIHKSSIAGLMASVTTSTFLFIYLFSWNKIFLDYHELSCWLSSITNFSMMANHNTEKSPTYHPKQQTFSKHLSISKLFKPRSR